MEEANVNVEGKDIRGREALDKETPIATAPARRFTLLPSIHGALVLAFFTVVLWNLLSELGWLLMLLYLAILLACGISVRCGDWNPGEYRGPPRS